jgi:hypothetical protein
MAPASPFSARPLDSASSDASRGPLERLLQRGWVHHGGDSHGSSPKVLPVGLPSFDAALPEGGVPRGAVVELTSFRGLSRVTTVALSLCASAQALARLRAGGSTRGAWCAWLDPSGSLSAWAAAERGVELERLLVVRAPWERLAKVAARVVESRVFGVVVVDTVPTLGGGEEGASQGGGASGGVESGRRERRRGEGSRQGERWVRLVRRLALAAEGSDTTVLLLTEPSHPESRTRAGWERSRHAALPVSMRLELERAWRPGVSTRGAPDQVSFRITKDRRGHLTERRELSL